MISKPEFLDVVQLVLSKKTLHVSPDSPLKRVEHCGPGEALQLECENLRQQVVEAGHLRNAADLGMI